jgi:hypothetical protein
MKLNLKTCNSSWNFNSFEWAEILPPAWQSLTNADCVGLVAVEVVVWFHRLVTAKVVWLLGLVATGFVI